MVLRRARAAQVAAPYGRGESRRYAVPGGALTQARCGWCCAGPGPLGERRNTTEDVPGGALTQARSGWCCAGPGPLGERACCDQGCRAGRRDTPQVWMMLRRPQPPRREANHEGMLRSGVPRGKRNITQMRMVLRWARPPRRTPECRYLPCFR